MKKNVSNPMMLFIMMLLFSCQKSDSSEPVPVKPESGKYYVTTVIGTSSPGKVLLDVKSYQQTTEYTCGPAAVLSLLNYLGKTGDEMTIAKEMGTSTSTGTNPDQMTAWLNNHGFIASWHEEGTLEMLRENLNKKIPTLIEWSDWGGHWALVVGYDTRNTETLVDDVIIFADPYDRHDDFKDGLTWFNAQRFYYMWYDALLFGRTMKRIYINAEAI
ncbi:MAG: C39 family peptidase [Bacteroidetes bacterium]|nr:C39 family peptidase [Bacteroidota bacterium]